MTNMTFFVKDAQHRIYRAYSDDHRRVYQVQEIYGLWKATVQNGPHGKCITIGELYKTDAMILCNEHEDRVLAALAR